MNDPTPDPHDDLLRQALRAEAEGVVADDSLRRRVEAATAAPSGTPARRVARLIAAAAIVALVVGVGVAVSQGDDEQEVDAVDDPSDPVDGTPGDLDGDIVGLFDCDAGAVQLVVLTAPGTPAAEQAAVEAALSPAGSSITATEVAPATVLQRLQGQGLAPADLTVDDVPTAWVARYPDRDAELEVRSTVSDLPGVTTTSSTDCLDTEVAAADRPDTIVLVREDGWLVVVDADGGQRELHFGGDPTGPPAGEEEGGPQFIDDVEISPDGEWVYFSTCCEPASGITFRIPIDGGEPEQLTFGAYPAVSPDGRWLATATGESVTLVELGGPLPDPGAGLLEPAATANVGCCARGLTWSPDGSGLAFTVAMEADAEPQVQRWAWDGATLTPVDSGKPDDPGWFATWLPDGMPNTVSGEPVADDRSLHQDRTYEWSLWVDQDGTLLAQGPGVTGDRIPLEGLPPALVADW
jgi:hypothetical protein